MKARCYRCGQEFSVTELTRREVVTARISGTGAQFDNSFGAAHQTASLGRSFQDYEVARPVSLCSGCAAKHDSEIAKQTDGVVFLLLVLTGIIVGTLFLYSIFSHRM